MKKEPIFLYIFRFLIGAGTIFFMGMLYWSLTLMEDDVKGLKEEMKLLRSDLSNGVYKLSGGGGKLGVKRERPHIDPSIPNLLSPDPFYETTLPKILGKNFKPTGIFRIATLARPVDFNPFSEFGDVREWTDLCTITVARQHFGKFDTYGLYAAIKMEEKKIPGTDKIEYWVHLRDDLFWQPLKRELFSEDIQLSDHFLKRHPVTAHDFKFYYDAVMNPNNQSRGAVAIRTYFDDIEEFRVIDDLTFAVRWKTCAIKTSDGKELSKPKYMAKGLTASLQPLASFVYQYFPDGKKIVEEEEQEDTYRTSTVWGQNFIRHWAKNIIPSCGPWVFEGMTDTQINFKRNTDFFLPDAALAEGLEARIKDSPEGPWQDFKADKIDRYGVQFDQLIEWENFLKSDMYKKQAKEGAGVSRLDYIQRRFEYIGWNQAKVFFKSKKVRRALTLAIDRKRIIRQNLNGYGLEIHGPFLPTVTSETDPSIEPWPYDPQLAKKLLEEEGWYDRSGTGIIEKEIDGKLVPFRFNLTYYVKNPLTKSVCEYVATALKEVGIDCNLNGVDVADLSAILDDKSFDAYFLAWGFGSPPTDPKQIWHSSGAKLQGSSNTIGFMNQEADEIIEKLFCESDPEIRKKLYYRFDAIIHEEQPYTFLFCMKQLLAYREYLKNVFIPSERQDLIPGADIPQPDSSIYYLKRL